MQIQSTPITTPRKVKIVPILGLERPIFRLRGKQPIDLSWQLLPAGVSDYVAGAAMYGIHCGGRLLVLDIDVKAGAIGEVSFAALCADLGLEADMPSVRTPSGGRHIYFDVPINGVVLPNFTRLGYDDLEFRYSRHYVVIYQDPVELVPLPEALYERLRAEALTRERMLAEGRARGGVELVRTQEDAMTFVRLLSSQPYPEDRVSWIDMKHIIQLHAGEDGWILFDGLSGLWNKPQKSSGYVREQWESSTGSGELTIKTWRANARGIQEWAKVPAWAAVCADFVSAYPSGVEAAAAAGAGIVADQAKAKQESEGILEQLSKQRWYDRRNRGVREALKQLDIDVNSPLLPPVSSMGLLARNELIMRSIVRDRTGNEKCYYLPLEERIPRTFKQACLEMSVVPLRQSAKKSFEAVPTDPSTFASENDVYVRRVKEVRPYFGVYGTFVGDDLNTWPWEQRVDWVAVAAGARGGRYAQNVDLFLRITSQIAGKHAEDAERVLDWAAYQIQGFVSGRQEQRAAWGILFCDPGKGGSGKSSWIKLFKEFAGSDWSVKLTPKAAEGNFATALWINNMIIELPEFKRTRGQRETFSGIEDIFRELLPAPDEYVVVDRKFIQAVKQRANLAMVVGTTNEPTMIYGNSNRQDRRVLPVWTVEEPNKELAKQFHNVSRSDPDYVLDVMSYLYNERRIGAGFDPAFAPDTLGSRELLEDNASGWELSLQEWLSSGAGPVTANGLSKRLEERRLGRVSTKRIAARLKVLGWVGYKAKFRLPWNWSQQTSRVLWFKADSVPQLKLEGVTFYKSTEGNTIVAEAETFLDLIERAEPGFRLSAGEPRVPGSGT